MLNQAKTSSYGQQIIFQFIANHSTFVLIGKALDNYAFASE